MKNKIWNLITIILLILAIGGFGFGYPIIFIKNLLKNPTQENFFNMFDNRGILLMLAIVFAITTIYIVIYLIKSFIVKEKKIEEKAKKKNEKFNGLIMPIIGILFIFYVPTFILDWELIYRAKNNILRLGSNYFFYLHLFFFWNYELYIMCCIN